ncbi:hypothetical protein [Brevundimonas mediterranea]|uniref:Uncharacterized protein n=1 Tax=Brevundimonas mediterranea TaxID=74329 RepID=A0A7Z9C656_9CAUL|nr:hypothetical protein [Brevundimonas mediterranea]VDC50760.1 hypothetical protein BREV_BREV_02249 [Brevundimonas mediterranea]
MGQNHQRQARGFGHARRQGQIAGNIQPVLGRVVDGAHGADLFGGDGRIGLGQAVGHAAIKIDQLILTRLARVGEDDDQAQIIVPGHQSRGLVLEGPLNGPPPPRRLGFQKLVPDAVFLGAGAADQQTGLRMMHQQVGMVFERKAGPFAGVHIDLEQDVRSLGIRFLLGQVRPVGADDNRAGRAAHAVEGGGVHRGVDRPGLVEAAPLVGQSQRPAAGAFHIAGHGDHLAVAVQHIVVSLAIHRGHGAAAPCSQVDAVQIDLVGRDIDPAHEQGLAVLRGADRSRTVKHGQHVRRAIQHLDQLLLLQIQHLAEEQFRPRHAQHGDAPRLRGDDQNPVLADPAQVAHLDVADVGGEQMLAGRHPGDGDGPRLAHDGDAGDQVAAGRQFDIFDGRRRAIGLKRRGSRAPGRALPLALGPGPRIPCANQSRDRKCERLRP